MLPARREVDLIGTSYDALGSHWRTALDAAEDALGTLSRNRRELQFPSDELQERARSLVRERSETEHLLEQVARLHHARLHRHLTGPRARPELIGLDGAVRACVFDLDGVLTASSALHAAAWQETFDPLLGRLHDRSGESFGPWRPFDPRHDYERYIHGRPRIEGVHAFLASRGIRLPEGDLSDPAGAETAQGLANRKNAALQRLLGVDGVRAFDGSTRFLEVAREAGLRCAVVSASANTDAILRRAGLAGLVDAVVDGHSIAREQLEVKPAPDTVLTACGLLGAQPGSVATFETTLAGIDAGRAAGVHRIFGVDRSGRTAALVHEGADRVVSDLGDLIDPALGD
jgi:beta-phosphoglucomutase-like phosphatase (HAD superfamily)